MRATLLLASTLALAGTSMININIGNGFAFRGPTASRNKGMDKSGMPGSYLGAKLARKAAQGKLTLRHS